MTGGRDTPQGRQVPCVEISVPALQQGYGHGGGGSQPCQEFGALLHGAVCTCCALCQTCPQLRLALLWDVDVLIACPALVQGTGEMELDGGHGL